MLIIIFIPEVALLPFLSIGGSQNTICISGYRRLPFTCYSDNRNLPFHSQLHRLYDLSGTSRLGNGEYNVSFFCQINMIHEIFRQLIVVAADPHMFQPISEVHSHRRRIPHCDNMYSSAFPQHRSRLQKSFFFIVFSDLLYPVCRFSKGHLQAAFALFSVLRLLLMQLPDIPG